MEIIKLFVQYTFYIYTIRIAPRSVKFCVFNTEIQQLATITPPQISWVLNTYYILISNELFFHFFEDKVGKFETAFCEFCISRGSRAKNINSGNLVKT
jgi:hypothetical protein